DCDASNPPTHGASCVVELMNYLNMLLLAPMAWAMCVAGYQINRWVCPAISGGEVAPMERATFALATGAITASQGILAIGVTGHLDRIPILVWFGVLALLGVREWTSLIRDVWKTLIG